VDIASGPGMILAGTYWEWGSESNCVEPSDALFISGVQGLEIVFTEREQANMAGALAASKGYTAGNLFYSQLNLTTYANGTETSQIVSMVGPKTLSNGEEINTTVFVPIRTFSLDPEAKKFTLTIDQYDQVSETNEQNVYELSFRMCWPADLTPGTAMYLLAPPGQDALEVRPPTRSPSPGSSEGSSSVGCISGADVGGGCVRAAHVGGSREHTLADRQISAPPGRRRRPPQARDVAQLLRSSSNMVTKRARERAKPLWTSCHVSFFS